MSDNNVSTAAELRADFEDEYLGAPPEYVKNTNGERVAVASAAEKRALEGGIVVLFSLAESYEARIAELEKSLDRTHANLDDRIAALEAKLDGLLGMGGGLDTALAKRDARIEALEAAASTKAREAYLRTIDPMQTYVPPDTPQELAALVEAASNAPNILARWQLTTRSGGPYLDMRYAADQNLVDHVAGDTFRIVEWRLEAQGESGGPEIVLVLDVKPAQQEAAPVLHDETEDDGAASASETETPDR